ncbi:MAG: cytochrome P450 [Acidimicrobiales bacterium]
MDDAIPPTGSLDERVDALVHRDQQHVRCPFPIFAELRDSDPVHYNEELGAWILTRYEDCLAVLHDPVTWSVKMRTGPKPLNSVLGTRLEVIEADPAKRGLLEGLTQVTTRRPILSSADPPIHVQQRKVVNSRFKPRRIRALEPLIEDVSAQLIDGFAADGRVEFVGRFAVPVPMTIIAHILGVGDEDLAQFKAWSDNLVMPVGNQHPSQEQVENYLQTQIEFVEFFGRQIEERQREPRDDLLSDISNAEVDGCPLEKVDHIELVSQLLAAGNETTTKLITDIAMYLALQPEVQSRVRSDLQLVDPLVEEVLRLEAPVSGLFRQATVDTELGGKRIAEGEHVWVLYVAANHDEQKFEEPDSLDIDRSGVKDHLGFGHGQHYCLGASLARTEAQVTTKVLLERLDDIALADTNDFQYEDSYLLRGPKRLDLTFTGSG